MLHILEREPVNSFTHVPRGHGDRRQNVNSFLRER